MGRHPHRVPTITATAGTPPAWRCPTTRTKTAAPRLILDAGTGLRRLPELLGDRPFRGTLLLTHLHWDHVQGLPFFVSGDRADAAVTLLLPADHDQTDAAALLERMMSPPFFPIGPSTAAR